LPGHDGDTSYVADRRVYSTVPGRSYLIFADIEGKLVAYLRQKSPNIPVSKRSTKRSITIADHKTSVSLEKEFWDSLREIADERGMGHGALVAAIDADRQHANLSSAIRIFVLQFYRQRRRTAPLGTPPVDSIGKAPE
jgi:predicted DNA-binding ribbon-helix-helix protein